MKLFINDHVFTTDKFNPYPIAGYSCIYNDYTPIEVYFVDNFTNEVIPASSYPNRVINIGVKRKGEFDASQPYVLFSQASACSPNNTTGAYDVTLNISNSAIEADLGIDSLSSNNIASYTYSMQLQWSDEIGKRASTNIVDFTIFNDLIKETTSPSPLELETPESWLFAQLNMGVTTQNVWTNYLNAQIQADVNVLDCNSANIGALGVGYLAPIASLSANNLSANTFQTTTISTSTISAINFNSTTLSSVSLSTGKINITNSSTSPLVDVYNTNSSGTAIKGIASSSGNGIEGSSYAGYGVKGFTGGTGYGVYATANNPCNAFYTDGVIRQVPVTYATLSGYSVATNGMRAVCSDSTTTTFYDPVEGGGTNTVPCIFIEISEGNGVWRVG